MIKMRTIWVMKNNLLTKILSCFVLIVFVGCNQKPFPNTISINWQDSLYNKMGWDTLKNDFISQRIITEEERQIIDNYIVPTEYYNDKYTYSALIKKAIQMEYDSFRRDCDTIEIAFPYGFGESPVISDVLHFLSGPEIVMSKEYTTDYKDGVFYGRYESTQGKLKEYIKKYNKKDFSYNYDPKYDFWDITNHNDNWSFSKIGDRKEIYMKYYTFGDSIYKMSIECATNLADLLKIKYGEPQIIDSLSPRFSRSTYMYGWNYKNIFLCCIYFSSESTYSTHTDYSKFFMTGKLSDIITTTHHGESLARTRITYTNKAIEHRADIYNKQRNSYLFAKQEDEKRNQEIELEQKRQQHLQDSIERAKALMNDL